MTAPRSVELDKDITLGLLKHDLVEVICDDVVDGLILRLRDRLAFNGGCNLTANELGNKITDSLGINR